MEMNEGNITTIATFLYVLIAPVLVKYGNFNLDESTFVAIVGFIIAFVSARNPNTMEVLGNSENVEETLSEEDTEADISDEGA